MVCSEFPTNAPHQFVGLKNFHPMSTLDLYAFMFIDDAQMPQHFGDFLPGEFMAYKDLNLTSLCDLFGISYVTPQAVK